MLVHPRHRPDRLSGRRRGGEHAAAGRADQEGRQALPCIGDGRQSGTSGLAFDPERLSGSRRHGRAGASEDRRPVRIDLRKGTADILISDEELAKRRSDLEAEGGFQYADHQTPWQEIQRAWSASSMRAWCWNRP
jgi:dihydroxyacid dehydratase/phosphogluconate dehydratase